MDEKDKMSGDYVLYCFGDALTKIGVAVFGGVLVLINFKQEIPKTWNFYAFCILIGVMVGGYHLMKKSKYKPE